MANADSIRAQLEGAAVGDANGAKSAGVSAIIVTYFTGPLLSRSIDAVRRQPDVSEIIIVDNGNWDGAVDAAIGPQRTRPDVKVITGQGNVGFARACNLGAAAATGDYFLFLNPDAVLPDGAVDRMLTDTAAIDGPWLMAPKLVDPDGAEQQGSRRATLTPWRAFVEATKLYRLAPRHPYFRRFNLHREPCPKTVAKLPVISGACFLLPRADYESVGGMDERYFLHVEDVDFCLRFANAGGGVWFNPHVSVLHYKSSSRVDPIRIEARKTGSMLLYFRRHFSREYPAPFLWLVHAALWTLFGVRSAGRLVMRGLGVLGLVARRGPTGARRMRELSAHRVGR